MWMSSMGHGWAKQYAGALGRTNEQRGLAVGHRTGQPKPKGKPRPMTRHMLIRVISQLDEALVQLDRAGNALEQAADGFRLLL